jgi:hypothetical protein
MSIDVEARRREREAKRAAECGELRRWGEYSLACIKPKGHKGPHRSNGIEWHTP